MIYADNAATTRIDDDALNLMIELQKKFFANPSSSYKLSRPLKKILQESREKIATCINAKPQEIFFTSGGTESNNWAIKSFCAENFNAEKNIAKTPVNTGKKDVEISALDMGDIESAIKLLNQAKSFLE